MEIRLPSLMIMIILLCQHFGLKAQENREASHTCFRLEEKRVIPLEPVIQQSDKNLSRSIFGLEKEWMGKQVFVRIPGTDYPYSIIINGFRFGSDPGSGIAAEYNITPFLNEQANSLDLVPVFMEGDSSAFSTPPASGSLLIRDAIHARDLVITSHPVASEKNILVRIDLLLKSYMVKENRARTISMELSGPDRQNIIRETRELNTHLSFGQETEMVFDLNLEDPILWLPGVPDLYELVISLEEKGGQKPELITTQFGITSFWHNDSVLVQNGDTIVLQYPSEDLAVILPGLSEHEIKEITQKLGINALRMDTPLPCHLEAVFRRTGILVVSCID
jgi:glycosyl hydrolase family 2